MFVRDSGRELDVRDLPPGRATFLGAFEDGVNTYWLLIDSSEVWMARGYEGDGDQQYGLVSSSVAGLQNVLEVWEAFAYSGKSDADDDYEDYVEDALERPGRAIRGCSRMTKPGGHAFSRKSSSASWSWKRYSRTCGGRGRSHSRIAATVTVPWTT